jgi:hypothetical protein
MRRQILAVTALGFAVAVGLVACEDKGPLQKAGEKVDRATGGQAGDQPVQS